MNISKNILPVILFLSASTLLNAQSRSEKPVYAGYIEYTKGNFGSFDHPQKGDSVYVYIKDSSVKVVVFPPASPKSPRTLEITFSDLKLANKKMFENIISPTEKKPSGSYDMKFEKKKGKDMTASILYLTHYGSGEIAEVTLLIEHYGVRMDDLFSATLVKVN